MTELGAVLFDLDGVLYAYDFENRLNLLESALEISAAEIRTKIFESGFEDAADVGAYTFDEYFEELSARLGVDVSPRQWIAARKWSMAPEPAVLDLARQVSAQIPIALLTHNGPILRPHLSDMAPELADLFGDNIFITCELGSGKEQLETFASVCARLGWDPETTLFVDDNPAYLKTASASGFRTHLFIEDEVAELRTKLAEVL